MGEIYTMIGLCGPYKKIVEAMRHCNDIALMWMELVGILPDLKEFSRIEGENTKSIDKSKISKIPWLEVINE